MKIWIINQYAVPPSQAGPTRHYSFAREMIRRGHEVTVIASSFDHVCRREAHLHDGERYRYEVMDDVPFLWLWAPPYSGNDLSRVFNMLTFAGWLWPFWSARRLQKPDVIIGSVPTIFAALAALRLAGHLHVPFVLEVRDLWPQALIDFWGLSSGHPAVRFLRAVESHLYRCSERIITLLPGSLDYLSERSGKGEKVFWLPNGIDLNLVPAPKKRAKDGSFTVMFIGNHGLAYGLDVLLDAALLLQREGGSPSIRFRLVGDGPDKARLKSRAGEEGIGIIHFEDSVPKMRIYELLQEADAFLMILKDSPIFKKGTSPNKVFDYLASVRPIIHCGDTTFDYIVEGRAGISVPAGDARALANAVSALARMPDETLMDMGRHGRCYVEEHFDIGRLAGGLEKVLYGAVHDFGLKKMRG